MSNKNETASATAPTTSQEVADKLHLSRDKQDRILEAVDATYLLTQRLKLINQKRWEHGLDSLNVDLAAPVEENSHSLSKSKKMNK